MLEELGCDPKLVSGTLIAVVANGAAVGRFAQAVQDVPSGVLAQYLHCRGCGLVGVPRRSCVVGCAVAFAVLQGREPGVEPLLEQDEVSVDRRQHF